MSLRTVTDTILKPDGTPHANAPVSFYLRDGSFEVLETYPPGRVDLETDENGGYAQPLWANGIGLVPSEYIAIYPGKERIRFVLPEDASPITMAELRAQEAWDWNVDPVPTAIELERARYANTDTVGLGDALIGTRNSGAGATARTAHDKFGDTFLLTDYDSFPEAVTAAAGETLVINAVTAPAANTTVPPTVTLEFTRAGRLNPAVGVTVTINGPIEAGRWPIFGGLGSIAGTPLIDYACPEWFGAVGTDATGNIDGAAFQKCVDFFPVVRGGSIEYIINSHRVLFTDLDLHALGAREDPQFNLGYGAGFILGSGAILEDCHFLLTGEVQVSGQLKAKHCVAIGEVDGARTTNVTMRRCTFKLHPNMQTDTGVAISTGRPRGYVACSVDGLTIEACRFEAPEIDVEPRENNIVGGFVFDSTEIVFSGNHLLRANFMAALEYCRHIKIVENEAVDSWQFVDCDKMNSHITIANNTYIRTENITTSSDPVFEINACDTVLVEDNIATYGRTFLVVSGKDNLYLTWAEALAQGGSGRRWVAWNNVRSINNKVSHMGLQAVLVGSTWETSDGEPRHADVPCGRGLLLQDDYWNNGGGLGRALEHAVVQIQEGTRVEVRCTIDGDAAVYTTLVGNVAEGATSFEVADASGITAGLLNGSDVSIILQTDVNHSQSHHTGRILTKVDNVLTITPAFPVTNPATGNPPLSPIATSGTQVRAGSQNAGGVWARSWVNGDTYTIDVAGVPTQFTVTDATDWSDLDIVIGGDFRNTAWPAITVSRPSELVLDSGLRVTDCGFHQVNAQQVLITRPELRQAIIRIRDMLIRRKSLAVTNGLQINSENFRTGGFSVDISDTRILAHTADLALRDSQLVGTPTESLALFSIRDSEIGTTNLNATTALSVRRPTVMYASGPPTGVAARDAWPRVGDVVMKYPPVAGQPIGWKCTDATAKPGVWKSLGNLES